MTIKFKGVSEYGFIGERFSDPLAELTAAALHPLEAVTTQDTDRNVFYPLKQNGEIVTRRDVYAVLVGIVGPDIRAVIIESDKQKFMEDFERDALVNDLNRCYDIRELDNIYKSIWFYVDYQDRVEELP